MDGVVNLNIDFLTCGTATWRIARNHSREPETTEIQTEFVVIILSNEFSVHLRHTVDCARTLDLGIE